MNNCGGSVAEWFRALVLKSGGPWLKASTLLLSGFVSEVSRSPPAHEAKPSGLLTRGP